MTNAIRVSPIIAGDLRVAHQRSGARRTADARAAAMTAYDGVSRQRNVERPSVRFAVNRQSL